MRRAPFVLLLSFLASCESSPPAAYDADFHRNLMNTSDAAANVDQRYVALFDAASAGQTVDLSTSEPPASVAPAFDATVQPLLLAQRSLVIATYRTWADGQPRLHEGPSSEVGRATEPLIGATGAASLVMFAAAGYKGLHAMVVSRSRPVLERATDATPDELEIYRDALDLPGATPAEIDQHLAELGPLGLWQARGAVFEAVNDAVNRGDPGVRPWEASAEAAAVAEAARDAGDTAVRQTVNGLLMVPGSQGVPEALRGAGLSSTVADGAEIALTVTSNQPLDVFESVFLSDAREGVSLDGAAVDPENAAVRAAGADADVDDAVDELAGAVAAESGVGDAPAEVHFGRSSGASTLPRGGRGTLVIQPPGEPAQESDVDRSTDVTVRFTGEEPSDAGPGGEDAGRPEPEPEPEPSDPDAECAVIGGAPIPGGLIFGVALAIWGRRRRASR